MARRKAVTHSRKEEVVGLLLMTLSILVFIALSSYDSAEAPGMVGEVRISNKLGIAGVYIAHFLIQYGLGYPSFVFPVVILLAGWSFLRGGEFLQTFRASAYLLMFALYTSIILALPEVTSGGESQIGFSLSGLVGGVIAQYLFNYLGIAGTIVTLLSLIMITVIGATNLSLTGLFSSATEQVLSVVEDIRQKMRASRARRKNKRKKQKNDLARAYRWHAEDELSDSQEDNVVTDESGLQEIGEAVEQDSSPLPAPEIALRQIEFDLDDSEAPSGSSLEKEADRDTGTSKGAQRSYLHPSIEFLHAPDASEGHSMTQQELQTNARILEDRLLEFGVEGRVIEINPGPVITRYDVEPAAGVKISRIVGLADDLALAMRAKRIRIVAPVPGKGAVGIEIPNRKHSVVYLREILSSRAFRNAESPLTIALGKTISGEPFVTNLENMPHLLIAGATGSGKSICLNSVVASILYKAHPTQVQFVMIDPKRLELTVYNDLRHHHLTYKEDLSEEVVTTADNAISILKSMCVLMDERYEILARAGVRNIRDYNKKLKAGRLECLEGEAPFEPLEYIVLIVDELADLMLTSAREIEEPIARLAQMARAVGFHLIVATQRPSVNVITGVIKANFPARIAFQVASKTDSRTILDLNGAEKLLGMGDMLFIPQGSPEPLRIHGAYVSVEEIEKIIAHIRQQPRYPSHTLPVAEEDVMGDVAPGEINGGVSQDPLFKHAMRLVVRHQQGSISLIQRRLKVGYARAARLIDELEAAGVVGPYDGSKAREVLMDEEELEEMDLG
ncbi:MAG: DNA translocase FtsK [bacterium]